MEKDELSAEELHAMYERNELIYIKDLLNAMSSNVDSIEPGAIDVKGDQRLIDIARMASRITTTCMDLMDGAYR